MRIEMYLHHFSGILNFTAPVLVSGAENVDALDGEMFRPGMAEFYDDASWAEICQNDGIFMCCNLQWRILFQLHIRKLQLLLRP